MRPDEILRGFRMPPRDYPGGADEGLLRGNRARHILDSLLHEENLARELARDLLNRRGRGKIEVINKKFSNPKNMGFDSLISIYSSEQDTHLKNELLSQGIIIQQIQDAFDQANA